jgi:hypothetical protein
MSSSSYLQSTVQSTSKEYPLQPDPMANSSTSQQPVAKEKCRLPDTPLADYLRHSFAGFFQRENMQANLQANFEAFHEKHKIIREVLQKQWHMHLPSKERQAELWQQYSKPALYALGALAAALATGALYSLTKSDPQIDPPFNQPEMLNVSSVTNATQCFDTAHETHFIALQTITENVILNPSSTFSLSGSTVEPLILPHMAVPNPLLGANYSNSSVLPPEIAQPETIPVDKKESSTNSPFLTPPSPLNAPHVEIKPDEPKGHSKTTNPPPPSKSATTPPENHPSQSEFQGQSSGYSWQSIALMIGALVPLGGLLYFINRQSPRVQNQPPLQKQHSPASHQQERQNHQTALPPEDQKQTQTTVHQEEPQKPATDQKQTQTTVHQEEPQKPATDQKQTQTTVHQEEPQKPATDHQQPQSIGQSHSQNTPVKKQVEITTTPRSKRAQKRQKNAYDTVKTLPPENRPSSSLEKEFEKQKVQHGEGASQPGASTQKIYAPPQKIDVNKTVSSQQKKTLIETLEHFKTQVSHFEKNSKIESALKTIIKEKWGIILEEDQHLATQLQGVIDQLVSNENCTLPTLNSLVVDFCNGKSAPKPAVKNRVSPLKKSKNLPSLKPTLLEIPKLSVALVQPLLPGQPPPPPPLPNFAASQVQKTVQRKKSIKSNTEGDDIVFLKRNFNSAILEQVKASWHPFKKAFNDKNSEKIKSSLDPALALLDNLSSSSGAKLEGEQLNQFADGLLFQFGVIWKETATIGSFNTLKMRLLRLKQSLESRLAAEAIEEFKKPETSTESKNPQTAPPLPIEFTAWGSQATPPPPPGPPPIINLSSFQTRSRKNSQNSEKPPVQPTAPAKYDVSQVSEVGSDMARKSVEKQIEQLEFLNNFTSLFENVSKIVSGDQKGDASLETLNNTLETLNTRHSQQFATPSAKGRLSCPSTLQKQLKRGAARITSMAPIPDSPAVPKGKVVEYKNSALSRSSASSTALPKEADFSKDPKIQQAFQEMKASMVDQTIHKQKFMDAYDSIFVNLLGEAACAMIRKSKALTRTKKINEHSSIYFYNKENESIQKNNDSAKIARVLALHKLDYSSTCQEVNPDFLNNARTTLTGEMCNVRNIMNSFKQNINLLKQLYNKYINVIHINRYDPSDDEQTNFIKTTQKHNALGTLHREITEFRKIAVQQIDILEQLIGHLKENSSATKVSFDQLKYENLIQDMTNASLVILSISKSKDEEKDPEVSDNQQSTQEF